MSEIEKLAVEIQKLSNLIDKSQRSYDPSCIPGRGGMPKNIILDKKILEQKKNDLSNMKRQFTNLMKKEKKGKGKGKKDDKKDDLPTDDLNVNNPNFPPEE